MQNKNVDIFINDVKKKCRLHGVQYLKVNAKGVDIGGGATGTGYFDCYAMVLAYAGKHENWLSTLIHESCHLDQWIEDALVWKRGFEGKGGTEIEEYCSGKKVKDIRRALNRVIELELDCEKRAVNVINLYKLSINVQTYIQRGNAYIQFYNYIKIIKRWSRPGNSPYHNPIAYSVMPKKFMKDRYYKKLPEYAKKAFIEADI